MTRAEYLRGWRAAHRDRTREYNRAYRARLKRYPAAHERQRRKRAALRRPWIAANRDAWNILQRMRQRGRNIMIADARELLAEYGRDYPLARGLSDAQRRWLRRQKDREGRRGRERHWELVFWAWEVAK